MGGDEQARQAASNGHVEPSETGLKVALMHDFLLDVRGAERVFEAICHIWPQADVFTAVYDWRGTEGRFTHRRVHTSFLQYLRPTARTFRPLLPLYPLATETLDLSDYDLIVSSSSAWAHGVIKREGAVHVCYCHNPFRYAWNGFEEAVSQRNVLLRPMLRATLRRWRTWDRQAAAHVDHYVANSEATRTRIGEYFDRDAAVVHPPVDTSRFSRGELGEHYLIISELMSHKRIDVAIEAFNRLGRELFIVGDGPESRRLARMAGTTVRLMGRVSDLRVVELLQSCRALVVTAAEEFGTVAVEAQACGRPVLALGAGGALETVHDGVTGRFYGSSDADSLAALVAQTDPLEFDPGACIANAENFNIEHFSQGLREQVALALAAGPTRPPRRPASRRLGGIPPVVCAVESEHQASSPLHHDTPAHV